MKMHTKTLVTLSVAIASLSGLAFGQESTPSASSLRAEAIANGTHLSVQVDAAGSLALVEDALASALAPAGASRTGRTLWTGRAPDLDWYGRMSAVTASDGAVRAALGQHGGGTRYVALWDVPADASGAERTNVESVVLSNVLDERTGEPLVGVEVASPEMFLFRGTTFVLGSTYALEDGVQRVFLARFEDLLAPAPRVRVVTEGVDPRVAIVDGQMVVAVRRPGNAVESFGRAPVALIRSLDGVRWTEDDAPEEGALRAARSFDLRATPAGLFAVTPQESLEALELLRMDPESAAWSVVEEVPLGARLDRDRQNVAWLGDGLDPARPRLLVREAAKPLRSR